ARGQCQAGSHATGAAPGTARAGYVWRLKSADQSVVVLLESRALPSARPKDSPPLAGAPAEQLFVLKAETAGQTEAVFEVTMAGCGRGTSRRRAPRP
ncbi:MAG TPA: protease inhibitor I42 family protein, partial [Methyloceanibacter sp.]|nr:protease inhibitor I42 family protein [Methyloceanibacter sp.]